MTAQIFSLFTDHFTQPFADFRVIHVVVVDPAFIAGVVGRINIDALHPPLKPRKQSFQRIQIVTMNDHVAAIILPLGGIGILLLQSAEGYIQMMVDHFLFSDPVKRRHGGYPPVLQPVEAWDFQQPQNSQSCSSRDLPLPAVRFHTLLHCPFAGEALQEDKEFELSPR